MLIVNDVLDAVLLGCFLFGLLFSIVLLVVGDVGLGHHFGGVDGGHHVGGHHGDGGNNGAHGLLPLNLSTLLAFVAWFGGIGYLARQAAGWPAPISLVVGVVGGLAGAVAIGWVMTRLFFADDAVMKADDYRMPGTIARVSSPIRANGTGEVVYVQGGVRQVSAARAADGRAIPRGAEVVVLETARGIAVVELAASFFGEPVAVDVRAARQPPDPSGREATT